MLGKTWQTLFLTLFASVFACLLLTGAPRLLASDAQPPASPARIVEQAYLQAAAPAAEQERAARTPAPEQMVSDAAASVTTPPSAHGAPARDANGNVLRAQTYLRTVYQAFSLGDGFA